MKTLSFHNLKVGRSFRNFILELDSENDHILISGGLYLLIAPNGFGKTTFLQTIAGLLLPLQGEIKFDGRKLAPELMTLYFSEYMTIPKFVYPQEWIEFVSNKKISRKELQIWIDDFALEDEMKTFLGHLSQGERRKVTWLGAYASEKPILLLDEPLDGLDFVGIRAARKMLQHWKVQGKTVFLVAHQPSEVLDLCDEFFYIQNQKLNKFELPEKSTPHLRQKLFETYEKELSCLRS